MGSPRPTVVSPRPKVVSPRPTVGSPRPTEAAHLSDDHIEVCLHMHYLWKYHFRQDLVARAQGSAHGHPILACAPCDKLYFTKAKISSHVFQRLTFSCMYCGEAWWPRPAVIRHMTCVHLLAIQPGGRQSNSLSCPWQSHVKSLSHGEKKSVGCSKFPQRQVLNKLNLVEKTSARRLEIRS